MPCAHDGAHPQENFFGHALSLGESRPAAVSHICRALAVRWVFPSSETGTIPCVARMADSFCNIISWFFCLLVPKCWRRRWAERDLAINPGAIHDEAGYRALSCYWPSVGHAGRRGESANALCGLGSLVSLVSDFPALGGSQGGRHVIKSGSDESRPAGQTLQRLWHGNIFPGAAISDMVSPSGGTSADRFILDVDRGRGRSNHKETKNKHFGIFL